jgi:hypothetical protein
MTTAFVTRGRAHELFAHATGSVEAKRASEVTAAGKRCTRGLTSVSVRERSEQLVIARLKNMGSRVMLGASCSKI